MPPLAPSEQILSRSLVLWAPEAEIALAEASAPVLEFAALAPIDLTDTHRTDITPARLEEMVAAYDPAVEMASLNLDHNYGGPSLGWCERIWMKDGLLWVRYIDLDPATVDLVRTKRYTRRSAEIALNHPVSGGWYFTACALLGNARPAVPALPPITLCRPQYVLTPSKETPVKPDPSAPPAPTPAAPPAQSPTGEAELATLRARVSEADQLTLQLRRRNAQLDVDQRLAQLGARVTPAMANLARPLLVELLSAPAPATVSLQMTQATAAVEVEVAEQILLILAAVPAVDALTSGRLAEEETSPLLGGGLSEERRRELDAKYSFTTTAFGFRRN